MPLLMVGLLLAVLVMLAFGGSEIDRTIVMLTAQADLPAWREAARLAEWLTQPLVGCALCGAGAAWLLFRRKWHDALLLTGAFLVGWVMILATRATTAPLRPDVDSYRIADSFFPAIAPALATMAGLLAAFLLTRATPARTWALGAATAYALAGGGAAILLGHVWPSAVIGGWAFGLCWVLGVLLIARLDLTDGGPSPLPRRGGKRG